MSKQWVEIKSETKTGYVISQLLKNAEVQGHV